MRPCRSLVLLIAILWAAAGQAGQEEDEPSNDTDPTKPVFFSVRDEYYNIQKGVWTNIGILRADRLVFPQISPFGNSRGSILRFEIPIRTVDIGIDSETGLGDLYAQALVIPAPRRGFTVAYGTGLVFPTATGELLGKEKWHLAPLLIPVQFFPERKGLALVKLQDWVSFAGDDEREDVHDFTVTPTALYRLTRRWFVLADSEAKVDWLESHHTSCKSGLEIGYMFSKRLGAWIKGEIPWGQFREGDWILRATVFFTRY
ncbi:MAG: hypothetical protein AB1640_04050 [bacterium]